MSYAVVGSEPALCRSHGGREAAGLPSHPPRVRKDRKGRFVWPRFYREVFTPRELDDMRQLFSEEGLDEEIATTRIILRRLLRYMHENPNLDAAALARLAPLAFRGSQTVAQLLRDQRALSGAASDGIAGAIGQALDELATEWGVEL
jgi:hypothetical protein